ncbi:D-alanyl-D-alanine carboxypeptidase [Ruminococcus sp. AF41-9]|nr:D-alanyl-D-alanine carboxypeptidase [Ruminococcus sp. AF41-9]
MKRKSNHSLRNTVFLFFTVLFLLFTCSLSTVYAASTLQKPEKAAAGKFVPDGDFWKYQYKDKTFAKNVFLKINNKTYRFNHLGHRWCSWHTYNGKQYYFGSRSQGYLIKNSLIRYKNNYYYVGKDGAMVTGWITDKSGTTYYFGKDGKAVTGKHRIQKTNYYFNANGTLEHTGLDYNLSSDCALLINANTGKVVYAKNENVRHANASTTKIMTCILALENCKLNEKVTFSPYAASIEPSKLYANAGEVFYLKDLLYSLMLPSHNDTAVAIAEHVSGSTAKFVNLMNKKAAAIGCTNTHFATPNGLDFGYDHYTTASDLAKIARYAIKRNMFRKLISTGYYSFSNLNTGRTYYIGTTNALLGNLPGVQGMKTGYTNKAGYCFVGLSYSQKGNTYISVVLGGSSSASRWEDSRRLLTYAYYH